MIDPSEVAQRYLTFKPMPPGNYTIVLGEEPTWFKLAAEIAAYGEQCRRAGAEAMRRASALKMVDMHGGGSTGWRFADLILALPLPSAAEAASPAAGWRDAIEAAAKAMETMDAHILVMWDRPGGPPGNGWRAPTNADRAAVIRALAPPSPPTTERARGG